jgi:hypothetical protein
MNKPWTELVRFRLFQMPCCGHSLCWVNPRLPNYCPECGKHVFIAMKSTAPVIDDTCTLKSQRPPKEAQ